MTVTTTARETVHVTGLKLKEVQAIAKLVVPKKHIFPVISSVKLVVRSGIAYFSATNCEEWVTVKVPTDSSDFSALIDFNVFKSIKITKKDIVTIAETGINVSGIEYGYSSVLPVEDFPIQEDPIHLDSYHVRADYFLQLGEVVQFAGTSECRPVLQSILHRDGNLVATDSKKLIKLEDVFVSNLPEFLLHAKSAKLVSRLFKGQQAQLSVNEHKLFIESDNLSVVVSLNNNFSYPNIERIIEIPPTKVELTAEVESWKTIHEKLLPRAKVANNVDNLVVAKLTETSTTFSVHKGSTQTSIYQEIDGEELVVAYNAKYMLDSFSALSNMGFSYGTVKFTGKQNPIHILAGNVHILALPIRLEN